VAKSKSPNPASTDPLPRGQDSSDIDSLSFEEAISRLEAIIDRIESGEVGLEESVKEYERGIALRRRCEQILAQAEQRVAELTPPELARSRGKDVAGQSE